MSEHKAGLTAPSKLLAFAMPLGTLDMQQVTQQADLETQDIVVSLPGGILDIGGIQRRQTREQAVAMPTTASPAGFDAITCDPRAQCLPHTCSISVTSQTELSTHVQDMQALPYLYVCMLSMIVQRASFCCTIHTITTDAQHPQHAYIPGAAKHGSVYCGCKLLGCHTLCRMQSK